MVVLHKLTLRSWSADSQLRACGLYGLEPMLDSAAGPLRLPTSYASLPCLALGI